MAAITSTASVQWNKRVGRSQMRVATGSVKGVEAEV
jgi:hypothetical protein